MPIKPIPDNYARVTPYLIVNGASKAIEYYTRVFDAKERMRLNMPDGKVGHCELDIGGSIIMVADECPEMKAHAPSGNSPVSLLLYVTNVDETFKKALHAGAREQHPVDNKFYGDRSGTLTDPFGHTWNIATHVEDVSEEEMQKRLEAMGKTKAA